MRSRIMQLAGAGLVAIYCMGCVAQPSANASTETIENAKSHVVKTVANERILIEEVWISAPIDDVWKAYTTEEGWTAWAAPKAEIDFRVGGSIRTAYSGEIGGDQTNTLQIVNYVPRRILTLKADVSKNWPEIMKKDADNLSNVILFDRIDDDRTRIQSYGIGYSDAPEYDRLMEFFIEANAGLYEVLKNYLESGARADWSN